jgi:hypothetical protein
MAQHSPSRSNGGACKVGELEKKHPGGEWRARRFELSRERTGAARLEWKSGVTHGFQLRTIDLGTVRQPVTLNDREIRMTHTAAGRPHGGHNVPAGRHRE